MTYLLDTDIAIGLIRGTSEEVRSRFRSARAAGDEIFISSITLYELWYGVNRSKQTDENTDRLIAFMSGPLEIVQFGELDAARAGLIRAELEQRGTPIGPYDLLIAAQAARRSLVLATGNTREFGRVDDLTIEDWTQPQP